MMLTARSNIKDKLEALRIGVDDYLLKPFQEEELLVRIENLIENAKNRQSEIKTVEVDNTTKAPTKKAKPKPSVSASDLKWLSDIEKRLQRELTNPKFSVVDLADELNVSRSQVQRRIKKITGLSPIPYFRQIRLQTAREILENGEMQTVSEVAYAVGFDTPAYFTKLYEKEFGRKPIEYLR